MNREDALRIIEQEHLRQYNWFNDHEIAPDEVGILVSDKLWSVFATDERASKVSSTQYTNESDALENFIKRLRAWKVYML